MGCMIYNCESSYFRKAKEKSWLLSYVNQILRKGDDALKLVIDALSKVEALVDDQVSGSFCGY